MSRNIILLVISLTLLIHKSLSSTYTNNENTRYRRAVINGPKKLIDEPACSAIIKSQCTNLPAGTDDLITLECIQSLLSSQIEQIGDDCQHIIWQHTSELMNDATVMKTIDPYCGKDLSKMSCKPTSDLGHLLACILDHKDTISSIDCNNIVKRLEWVAFSDLRLVGQFVRDCAEDIDSTGCGRLSADRKHFSQGETLACLQGLVDNLKPQCKKGILHLSELQSENIKLDRKLFQACVEDSNRFCGDLRPGTGAVYKCLLRHKSDDTISPKCQEQLLRREQLIVRDYRVSKGLARSCRDDIKNNHCRRGVSEDKDVRLAQILLCLEAAHKNNTKISHDCLAEMTDHRKLLMDDYHVSPEIVSGCGDDIDKFCNGGLDVGGKTIHCLMEHARPKKKKDRRVTAMCQRALETLLKVSDVGEDWRVDPILKHACKPVVDTACRDTDGGDARVMSCLMEKLGTNYMNSDCEAAIMQIQYFVARDFKLDPQLYRNCKDDAIRLCKAKRTWADLDSAQMDPERGPLILPCLHRYAYHAEVNMQLKPACLQEVKRVMRQRAYSVDLIPEVEDECLPDLSNYCFDKTAKGEEMQCLQDNLDKLQDKCKAAVTSYTEEEAAHIELNPIIMTYCADAMERNCKSILQTGNDEGNMMECLISHKNDPELRQDLKCRAAIEHFQIISLKNFHFTYKFKEACRPHVVRFCPTSDTKFDVVACLSEVMRNDTLKGQRHTIPKECRQQIRSQLLQQRENIDFDPKLKAACQEEIKTLCLNVPHGAGQVLECLQTNPGHLGPACRHAIFSVKKSELTDSSTDYTLMNTCKDMIKQYCHNTDTTKSLDCLKLHKDEPFFDANCHLVVVNRMIEQNMDYRFNPALQEACSKNIADYCTAIVAGAKKDEELNGKVVQCLKVKFREGKLAQKCETQLTQVLHEQALNYRLNPLLQTVCRSEIDIICKPADEVEEHGEVEECLKNAFMENKLFNKECRIEVAILIQEAKADIHVDPLLQRACTIDLLKYCSKVPSGNGRQLKCLQIIMTDQSKALEEDCKSKLEKRIEMFQNAAKVVKPPEDIAELYNQVLTSPAKKFFLICLMTFIGCIFIFGMFCGRISKRRIGLKNK